MNKYKQSYEQYTDINDHPDLLYELKMWAEIKDDMDYPEKDNNNGFIHGIYWLDYNSEVVGVEWFKTEQKRFDAIDFENKRLREAFYGEVTK